MEKGPKNVFSLDEARAKKVERANISEKVYALAKQRLLALRRNSNDNISSDSFLSKVRSEITSGVGGPRQKTRQSLGHYN